MSGVSFKRGSTVFARECCNAVYKSALCAIVILQELEVACQLEVREKDHQLEKKVRVCTYSLAISTFIVCPCLMSISKNLITIQYLCQCQSNVAV